MQLRHLETFIAIVDSGTLTAAAARLFKTQAAVSQDLKALESGLGLDLIDRSGQRATLTPAGLALVPMARRVLGDLSDVETEMERLRVGGSPIVRIGCLPSLALRVSALIGEFGGELASVRWSLITTLRGAMIDGIRTAQFDMVICEARAEDDIINTPIAREALRVILPADHPLAERHALQPGDLTGVPYIGLDRGMGATIEAQRFFASGDSYPTPAVEVNDIRLVLDLVLRFNGFGIVPVSASPKSDELMGQARFAAIPTDPPMVRQLALVQLAGRSHSPTVEAFAAHLVRSW